ncbi:MAG: hypothetical protein MZV65_17745 [Chromatiales bacterium]|nr:hypothetical protein [Chromatiales bacterium]
MAAQHKSVKYPGIRAALDGNSAVIMCEREATRCRRRLPDHALDPDGRVLGRGTAPRATSTSPAGR